MTIPNDLKTARNLRRVWPEIADGINLLTPTTVTYCDYSTTPSLKLTTTPQIVTGWSENITPFGISESNGRFTVNDSGVFKIDLERIYENDDNNPSDKVFITISVYKNSDPIAIFTRTAPIASATANDEPAIDTFTTPSMQTVNSGDYFEVYVSGEDNGLDPQDTELIRMKIVANKVHNLPD